MTAMSKEAEEKILRASAAAAELVNEGQTPNDAITKAASEANLPPGHISLLVNAYNTGRTSKQREVGDSPFEKAADFDLADTSVVLERLYPSEVKTAAAIHQETAVSWEYLAPPAGMVARRREKLAKAAAPPPPALPPPDNPWKPNLDEQALHKRAIDRTRVNDRKLEEARAAVSASFHKAAGHFDDLRTYFREGGHTPFGDVATDIELRFGGRGESVMTKLAEVEPQLRKEAATDRTMFGVNKPAIIVEALLAELEKHAELQIAYDDLAVKTAAANKELLLPFAERPTSYILEASSSEKTGSFAGGALGASMKDVMNGVATTIAPPEAGLANKSLQKLTDPQHEAELRNIRTQAQVQDMMNNDPVLSGYPADEFMGAFNEISELAPRVVDQRMIMTSLLRKRLQQGSLDPFEIDQLLGMDNKLKRRDGGLDAQPSGSII